MKKSLIALAMTIAVTSFTVAYSQPAVTFADVPGTWAQTHINTVTDLNIMNGYTDGRFHPEAWVTRGEFSNMSVRALALPTERISRIKSLNNLSRNSLRFGTVDNPAWISAYPSNVFRPENPVRRVEALTALAGTLDRPLVSREDASLILEGYEDAELIPANVRREVATAIHHGLYTMPPGTPSNRLEPQRPITRAEVAVLMDNLRQNRDITIAAGEPLVTYERTAAVTEITEGTALALGAPDTVLKESPVYKGTMLGFTQPTDRLWLHNAVPYRTPADTVVPSRQYGLHTATGIEPLKITELPAGTTFMGTVAKSVYSEYNRPGDPVLLILNHPLSNAEGRMVAPAGSQILGRVIGVSPHNVTNQPALLGLHFYEIVTPTGERLAINATVANTAGYLQAQNLEGVVVNPQRSTAALKREISASEGGLYGTKSGKMDVLDTPLVTLAAPQPLRSVSSLSTPNVLLGVGDRLQLRPGSPALPPEGFRISAVKGFDFFKKSKCPTQCEVQEGTASVREINAQEAQILEERLRHPNMTLPQKQPPVVVPVQ